MELIDFRNSALALATMLTSFLMLMLPAAAAESVIIPVEFNTESNESFTVAVLGESNCDSATSPSECAPGISFNCSAASNGVCSWVEPQGMSGSPTQQDYDTADQAIFIATNTGTATLDVTMKAHSDINSGDACLNMTMTFEQEDSCTTTDVNDTALYTLKTTDVTLNSSWTSNPTTQICVWLFGNFSSCTSGIDSTYIYFNSTVA